MRSFFLCIGISITVLGQGLPDRDELVEKLLQPEQSIEATKALVDHYQLGGVRTVLRNLGAMPLDMRLDYAQMFTGLDLFRFRNDLNTNLSDSKEKESQALFLMLMSSFGRKIDRSVFEKYANDEEEELFVRLAAASGLVKFQNPTYYDLFVSLVEDVKLDMESMENVFRFADISKKNEGFYYYVLTKVNKEDFTHGHVVTVLAMADKDSMDLYQNVLTLRQKKYLPLMINRAMEVGGVELLEFMNGEKACKKFRNQIADALPAAKIVAEYRDRFFDKMDPEQYPIKPFVPFAVMPRGLALNRSYAIIKVSETGEAEIVKEFGPFSNKGDVLKSEFDNLKTFPAYLNWAPVESLMLVATH